MPWVKGQSGNPKGAIPKPRALTTILEKAGAKTVDVDGKKIARKQLAACLVWQGITTGRVKFPNGDELVLEAKDWRELVKFPFAQIDGLPKQDLTLSGNPDAPLLLQVVESIVTHRNASEDQPASSAGKVP